MILIKMLDGEKYYVETYTEREKWVSFERKTNEGKKIPHKVNKAAIAEIIDVGEKKEVA